LGDGQIGVNHPEVADRVHFNRDVVVGDDVLWRNIHGFQAQADAREFVDGIEDEIDTAGFGVGHQFPQAQYHAALPFFDYVQRILNPKQEDCDDYRHAVQSDVHCYPPKCFLSLN